MDINETIEVLKSGGTILYPTDTIWGLGCDATNDDSCKKIIEIKERPEEKSFIVLVDSIQMLEKYVPDFHQVCYDLIDYTDKPLTIIYPSAKGLAPSVLAKDGTVGIRVTKDENCIKLIRGLKRPIVSTSANVSSEQSPKSFQDINDSIKKKVDGILELRLTETMSKPSQIIKIDLSGNVKVIRQ